MRGLKGSLILGMLLICSGLFAQDSDFGLWTNLYVEKKLVKRVDAFVELQGRLNQNATNYYYSNAELGMTFRPLQWMHISGAYVFAAKESFRGGTIFRNQYYTSVTLKAKMGRFRISNRSMFQSKMNDSFFSEENLLYRDNYYRNKLVLKFDISRKLRPYVAQEFFLELNDPKGNDFNRSRSYAGIHYQLNKRSLFEVYYLMQKELFERYPQTDYVVGIGYEWYIK